MADGCSVKVAVRIRPFNGREKEMNSKCCVKMNGPTTIIYHPETNEDKKFAFDYSYWSHDGFSEGENGQLIPLNDQYATQRKVYDDLGQNVLNNAFEGYNSTLFAYGQTGAGKSFSMVGYGVNKGIIPIVCSEMFKAVENAKKEGNKQYEVTCTMLEIYNEAIRDLLDPSVNIPGGLKVRSKPGIGVYVERLTPVAVDSYESIEKRMDEGTGNRTVASTKMNATSSRAHTVFGINFTQRVTDPSSGQVSETTARMNLVDLAGSERAESTGATGDRLKEGCAINASLSALGNVISALADIAGGKKKVFVPYRNSALTRLLQDALGGNSKTVMIAALSPADVNYDETLGTLRYADRAKKIKNNVAKMENPTDKIIRLLKEENARLLALLSGKGIDAGPRPDGEEGGEDGGGGGAVPAGANPEEIEALKAKMMEEAKAKMEEQMKENERMIEEMKKSWEQKLKEAEGIQTSTMGETGATSMRNALASDLPRIVNLHEDTQLSECVVYMFKKGDTKIGRKNADAPQDVMLSGLNIAKEHAIVHHTDDGKVIIQNLNKSKTFVNGDIVTNETELHPGDRVILGNNFVFRFDNPKEESKQEHVNPDQAWANAMDEFATKQGMRLQQSLGGEMGKLEVEEAQKRKELEAKLAAMEETMRKEREVARSALDQQKQMLMSRLANGGQLTEDEKAQMAASEAAFKHKEQDLEAEMSKRRDLSEKIIQEQMKRKRQTKKIEERLAKLMPLVAEANSMAEELGKPVRFEARLAVKSTNINLSALDELRNLKTIDVTIRVTSQENGNVWTWNHVKFDSRLYMMREIYQEFMDYGPREIPKSKDPFWDPPEAIEIGKAYVYLKALSQLVEIENEFAIVDYKGDEQGQIQVDIYPEGINGEEIQYLESSDELLGKSINLLVRVSGAKGIPAKFSNDVYVTFAFGDQTCETEACEMKTTDPKWKFEHRFKFESITDEFRQYLLKDAAVFEVRGFSDPPVDAKQATITTGGATTAPPTKIKHENLCGQCEEKLAHYSCHECQLQFCDDCFNLLHKSAKKAGHLKIELAPPPSAAAKAHQCFQCEENGATVQCKECDKQLCDNCNQLLHKSEKKAKHERVAIQAHAVEAGKCNQCEEVKSELTCAECSKQLCAGCDGLLHKSAKKATHVRTRV